MNKTIRTFIAIKLPENIISSIGKAQKAIKPYNFNIRWTRPENMHLTIKFLGNTKIADIQKINSIMEDTVDDFAPIALAAKGIGVFPELRHPRVLWVGFAGDIDYLVQFQKILDIKLKRLGFSKEKRPFKGHLTLGRIKGRIDQTKFFDIIKKFQSFESKVFVANEISLLQSELKPAGPVYSKLLSVKL